MSGIEGVRSEVDGHIGILTIDRPKKLNALTLAMIADLRSIAAAFDADSQVWVIVIVAEGERSFSVGGDLRELIPAAMAAGSDVLNPDPAKRWFSDVFTPIVVGVNGLCLGAGFELMLGTDIRIAADSAAFGLPEVGIGLIPGSGTNVRLARQLPWPAAMNLLLGGDNIDAETAHALGLVNEVVPAAELRERTMEKARRLVRNGPLAMRTAKEIAVRSLALEQSFALEHALNSRVITSHDAKAGVASFTDKTVPRFGNH